MNRRKTVILLFLLVFITEKLYASGGEDGEVNWFFLAIGLLGGLALFLYGMEKMSDGLKKSAGKQMRNILSKLTNNRFIALGIGAFVTMVIQSSSATTVMLVSFVQSGLMNFSQSLGVILGANIGTTFTAQLIAFKLTDYAVLMIAIGFAFRIFSKKEGLKSLGDTVLGFGLLFYGMKLMSSSMAPLRTYTEFIEILKHLEYPITGIIIGLIFTALIQSSSAFTGIVILLAQQNLITLEAGIPLIIGANIGTCVTAGISSIGTTREAKRVALVHTFYRIIGALIFVFWIPYFAKLVNMFGAVPAREIAIAHTIFNTGIALLFIPFIGITAKLMIKILPPKEEKEVYLETHYLTDKVLQTPQPAIDLAIAEIARAAKILSRMLEAIIMPFTLKKIPNDKYHPELKLIEALNMREEEIDYLEHEIADFLIKLSREGLGKQQVSEVFGLLSIINDIESVGDIIFDDMIPLIKEKEALESDFSSKGKEELIKYHIKISKQLSRLRGVFEKKDSINAVKILVKGEKYTVLETKYLKRHFDRIYKGKEKTVITHKVHIDLFDSLKQIGVYLENIAKTIAETSPFGSVITNK